MSYRLTWSRLKKMEEALGRPLVENSDNRRGGYRLTPAGEELARVFRQREDDVHRFSLAHAPQLYDLGLETGAEECSDAEHDPAAPAARN